MTTSLATLIRLRAIQNKTRQLFEGLNDLQYRLQYHPDLSPAGWYLGHGIFMENYWLHEIIQGNKCTAEDTSLFYPLNCPLPEQGPRLSPLSGLLKKISAQQDINDLFLLEKTPPISNHPLFQDETVQNLIIQQYAHDYESIYMVLNQIALKKHIRDIKTHPYTPKAPLISQPLLKNIVQITKGNYTIGGIPPYSADNELPSHEVPLDDFFIAHTPVTNAQYLLFIEVGGYNNSTFWRDDAWQWREKNNIEHPEYWAQNSQKQWYGINHLGPYDLNINDAVYGLSHYEASAFAHWAGARLPHEHEWETAARLELIKSTTQVWEWCNNTIAPYEGFKAFPFESPPNHYQNHSHFVLKGASFYTRKELRRASYRNAYLPYQRHLFAGLRLVFT
ncbi:hypothetical protein MNBD_GAMMA07-2260 [hydrothermal vent metagenome]|uniref:Ergothioneine biosynthesis protein EgtB n=1 Tax=hydrothermal vent metagenome TaxID=652676 RepID=A0A3B0XIF5_9ZZZZ